MREILFRGKRVDNGEWVYGYLGKWPMRGWKELSYFIIPLDELNDGLAEQAEVDPATVGQYTGLTDKNGKKIWESDILFDNHPNVQKVYSVIWFDGSFVRRTVDGHYLSINALNSDEFEIIGNTIDNPELLQN